MSSRWVAVVLALAVPAAGCGQRVQRERAALPGFVARLPGVAREPIDAERFMARVEAGPAGDEVGELAVAFNEMLAALDRQEELGMHLRATLNTGVTRSEVREVLMQVAVYAGVPAANSAIKTAKRVFAEDAGDKGA